MHISSYILRTDGVVFTVGARTYVRPCASVMPCVTRGTYVRTYVPHETPLQVKAHRRAGYVIESDRARCARTYCAHTCWSGHTDGPCRLCMYVGSACLCSGTDPGHAHEHFPLAEVRMPLVSGFTYVLGSTIRQSPHRHAVAVGKMPLLVRTWYVSIRIGVLIVRSQAMASCNR